MKRQTLSTTFSRVTRVPDHQAIRLTLILSVIALAVTLACSFAGRVAAEPVVANSAGGSSSEASVIAPISERFVKAETDEVPNFQKHVVPLLGRLGCNGRACHGSFQGRGGLQLSLFGYDFQSDHAALLDEQTGR